jgi:hypothetical protein
MRTWNRKIPKIHWKHVYDDALCEIDPSLREEKIEAARHAILNEIEDALHARRTHPHITEIRCALRVINSMLNGEPENKAMRSLSPSTSSK